MVKINVSDEWINKKSIEEEQFENDIIDESMESIEITEGDELQKEANRNASKICERPSD